MSLEFVMKLGGQISALKSFIIKHFRVYCLDLSRIKIRYLIFVPISLKRGRYALSY